MVKDGNTVITLIAGSVFFATNLAFLSSYELTTSPFGIKSDELSIIFTAATPAGIIGSIFSCFIASKYKKYKAMIIFFAIMNGLIYLSQSLIFTMDSEYRFTILIICFCFFNICEYSIIPIGIEYLCEVGHPVGEATLGGFLAMIGNILGVIIGAIANVIVADHGKESSIHCVIYISCWYFLSAILFLFTK